MIDGRRALLLAAVCGLLVLQSGCAYFNTFYLARKYYSDAERSREKTESDKLPPDAIKKYEDSIVQCQKVLRDHGGSRWADDAVYLMGASYYGKKEYENAIKTFDDLSTNYPESELVPEALYMQGLCYFERRDYQQMTGVFDRVMLLDPVFEHRDAMLFTLAQAAERDRNRPEAVRRYRTLIGEYPGSERSDEALLRIGDLYFDAASFDSALTSYQELTRTTRKDKFYQEGQLKTADALLRLGRPDDAIEILGPLVPANEKQTNPEPQVREFPARVRLALARAENSAERPDRALEHLRKVTTLYPASTSAGEAHFQIGYTYEVYMDSLEAAKKAYEQAGKNTGKSVFREQAQTRLNNLRALQDLSTQAQSAGEAEFEKKAEASLKIGELYLFSQSRVEDAIAEYQRVMREYPTTRIAPRAAYGLAWIHLNMTEGTRDTAYAELRGLIRGWPASTAAHAALKLLVSEKADTFGLTALLEEAPPETLAAVPTPASDVGISILEEAPEDSSEVARMPRGARPGRMIGPDSLRGEFDELRLLRDRAGVFDSLRNRPPLLPADTSGALPESTQAPGVEP